MAKQNIKQVIGANVRRLRSDKGFSQVDLGERVGEHTGRAWSAQVVSGAESGKREFVAVEVVILCRVLNCTIGDLLLSDAEAEIEVSPTLTMRGAEISNLAPSGRYAMHTANDLELTQELMRRMKGEAPQRVFDSPMEDQLFREGTDNPAVGK